MTQSISLSHDVAGSGPLLVAIHGITEDRSFWDRVPLAEHFRAVRVDLRGHGQSARIAPYDPLTLAGDVHELVASSGNGEPPLVVGHSYGGVVATAYASRFPVRGVVNVDQRLDVAPLPEQVAQAVRGPGFEEFMTSFFSQFYGQLEPAVAVDLDERRQLRQDVVLGAWAPLLDLGADELTAWMKNITNLPQPTAYLSLHGLPVNEDYATWLRKQIPGAVVEAAPIATHYPHLADPSWFVQRVTAFDAGHVMR